MGHLMVVCLFFRTRIPLFVVGEQVKCTLEKHHKLDLSFGNLTIVKVGKRVIQCRDGNGTIAGVCRINLTIPNTPLLEQNDLATNIVTIREATLKGIEGPISAIAYKLDHFIHINLQSADMKFMGSFSIPTNNQATWYSQWTLGQLSPDDYRYIFTTDFKHFNHVALGTCVQIFISGGKYVHICIFNPQLKISCTFVPPTRLQQWIIDKTFLLSFD